MTEILAAWNDTINILRGVIADTEVSSLGIQGTGDFAYPWILAKSGTFCRYTGSYIPAGKAYLDGALLQDLQVENANALRIFFESLDDNQHSGLNELNNESESAQYFNLNGQRVAQPVRPGTLYIQRGNRKVVLQ